jgi:hypothetical protein
MTTPAAFSSAPAREAGTPATTAPEAARPWWRRLLTPAGPRRPWHEIQHEGLERLLALLEAAREDLSAGWLRGAWWTSPVPGGQQILMTGLAAGSSAAGSSAGGPSGAACLVGALIRAGARQGGDSEAGRAVDVVYDELWESRGQPAGPPGPSPLPVSAPQVRQAKVQALTRWNDTPERTGDEVLAVVDRAIARVIQNLAALPAPRTAAGISS